MIGVGCGLRHSLVLPCTAAICQRLGEEDGLSAEKILNESCIIQLEVGCKSVCNSPWHLEPSPSLCPCHDGG
jgi:hypothetical protein